ncbi:hypothetical protein [Sphingomonas colocasiae]|uniref:Uncharacterized protein n=1 Tax=Sphingomonas colocasiae TaxID=1848973 RepID=A0ABS7PNW0_9SPHN|nr:hypothetical protein [Sphingomonas colocasiae]MBY8823013.1 hypothetical protein [Sphingomonas colocasiae]
MMWRFPLPLLTALIFLPGESALAQRCFDPFGREASSCPGKPGGRTQYHGDTILMDEKGAPLARAIVIPAQKKKELPKVGVADMNGREIAAARFDRVYAVSRNLVVGEMPTDPKNTLLSQRAFLIDLKSGEIRATPWRSIWPTNAGDADGPPYLLGVEPATWQAPHKVAILEASGGDTGLRVENVNPFIFSSMPRTLPYNLIGIGDRKLDVRGEDPFTAYKLRSDTGYGYGYFIESGPLPAEIKGPGARTGRSSILLTPLASDGTPQALPPGIVGMVQGGSYMWIVRRTPNGMRYHQHHSGKPVLGAEPTGEAYLDLYLTDRLAMVRTAAGWMDPFVRKIFPTPEAATAAREAELKAFVAQVMAEDRANKQREIQRQLEAEAEAKAASQARIAAIKVRMQEAKAGKVQGWRLMDLQRDVMAAQLEGQYEALGLRLDPDIKRQICWQRQSIVCNRSTAPASSGSGFVSSWEKAFENARALNQSQYRENCAAASMGANRICRVY